MISFLSARVAAVLAASAVLSLSALTPARAEAPVSPPAGAATVSLAQPDGAASKALVWAAPQTKAVVVFAPGGGGQPARYERLLAAWAKAGFTVVAPVHEDAIARGELGGAGGQQAFGSRIGQLAAARAWARQAHPGKPLVVAGHSFGSMMSLVEAGGILPPGAVSDPDIKALVLLSSPGRIPGLIGPTSYAAVSAPLLQITGDADLVPGLVTDWKDHRLAFDTSRPGDKLLLVVAGADHGLPATQDAARFDWLVTVTTDFIAAEGLDDAAAKARLEALKTGDGVTVERR